MNFLETYEIFWESNFVSIVLNKRKKVLGWSNVVCGVAGQKPQGGGIHLPRYTAFLHIFFPM